MNVEREKTTQFQELCIAVKNLTRLNVTPDEIIGQVNLALDEVFESRSILIRKEIRPLMATFRPQQWVSNYAHDLNENVEFDATKAFLSLSLKQVQSFQQNNYDSDELANDLQARKDHSGPFEVDVEIDYWLEQNGFPERKLLSENKLQQLRSIFGVSPVI